VAPPRSDNTYRTALMLDPELLVRAERLMGPLKKTGVEVSRSSVLRMALIQGLGALEKLYELPKMSSHVAKRKTGALTVVARKRQSKRKGKKGARK